MTKKERSSLPFLYVVRERFLFEEHICYEAYRSNAEPPVHAAFSHKNNAQSLATFCLHKGILETKYKRGFLPFFLLSNTSFTIRI